MEYSTKHRGPERNQECHSMKLDLLTSATVDDDHAIRFVSGKSKEKRNQLLDVAMKMMRKNQTSLTIMKISLKKSKKSKREK
jgi:hypothetical protein